jgi:DNA-nicking Smr family endonuclease
VRRGKLEIDATLDLHGYSQEGGYLALATFLQSAGRRGGRVALVITGMGRLGEGVLRKRLPEWLAAKELKPLVSGYALAHRSHGGAGAFYVFLKRVR